ncbi:MAG: PhoH family protein [Myxococcota bacterium]
MGRSEEHASSEFGLTTEIEVTDSEVLLRLVGPGGRHLKQMAKELGLQLGHRGTCILLAGAPETIALGERVVRELLDALEKRDLSEVELGRLTRMLRDDPTIRLRDFCDEVVLITAQRKSIRPKGLSQQNYVHAMREHDVVFGVGPAGTGKTYLAMAMAVHHLLQKRVKRIVLTRPAVEAGERLGFLPGDLEEKVNPYLRPLYDALYDMMDEERVEQLLSRNGVEVAPLAFMRGRTLNDCFVILDEAQNTTVDQMKMFLTRLGAESKAAVTGDITQVDLPSGQPSGLADAVSLLSDIEGIKVCRFYDGDVVRHPLVQRIVQAYEARSAQRTR